MTPDSTATPRATAPSNIGGWLTAALLVGLISLGLPWGPLGSPGYTTVARVPVVAAGVVVVVAARLRSDRLVWVAMAFGVLAIMLGRLSGSGPLALALALLLLYGGVRRTPAASREGPTASA